MGRNGVLGGTGDNNGYGVNVARPQDGGAGGAASVSGQSSKEEDKRHNEMMMLLPSISGGHKQNLRQLSP